MNNFFFLNECTRFRVKFLNDILHFARVATGVKDDDKFWMDRFYKKFVSLAIIVKKTSIQQSPLATLSLGIGQVEA